MISVRIPKDIRSYKEKLIAGLTARQLIAVFIALVICVPTYIYGRRLLGDDLAGWLVMIVALPAGAVGFYRKNGLPFEKFAAVIIRHFLCPGKRSYQTENAFRLWQNTIENEEITETRRGKRKWLQEKRNASLGCALELWVEEDKIL